MRYNVSILDGTVGEQHVLFAEGHCRLQLAISGGDIRDRPQLVTGAIVAQPILARRLALLRRLSDLAARGFLAPRLYPPMSHSRRLHVVLQSLDGALDGASHRDIAIALLGIERVKADWADPSDSLRNRVRAALRRAKGLMNGGYLELLQ